MCKCNFCGVTVQDDKITQHEMECGKYTARPRRTKGPYLTLEQRDRQGAIVGLLSQLRAEYRKR